MVHIKALLKAVFWALTWGLGAAIGVALGGWLTVVGGAGAPGTEALDLSRDLFVIPLIAGGVVFLAHLIGNGVFSSVRSVTSRIRRRTDGDGEDNKDDGIRR